MYLSVADLSLREIEGDIYDLAIFASGYESRATFFARKLNPNNFRKILVLGFSEATEEVARIENDIYFTEAWRAPLVESGDGEGTIYTELNALGSESETVKILVDYSSMSRIWYSSILNWARFSKENFGKQVVIDFCYVGGVRDYPGTDQFKPMIIKDILCLPGMEGSHVGLNRSVAIFGLGFEGEASLCVMDQIEPDEVISFYADPAEKPEYVDIARERNGELIEEYSKSNTYGLPLESVSETYRNVAEYILPYLDDCNVTLVPMGPKPHILAALLVATKFSRVSCLRVSSKTNPRKGVLPGEKLVISRISFA